VVVLKWCGEEDAAEAGDHHVLERGADTDAEQHAHL
jgi:hypothetical protein